MTGGRFAIGLLAGMTLASGVFAQGNTLESGRLRTVKPAGGWGTTKADARTIGRKFGQCVVARSPGRAERYLSLPIGSNDQKQMTYSVLSDECLGGGEFAVPYDVVRGVVFEAMYLRDFAGRAPGDIKAVPPVDYRAPYPGGVPPVAVNAVALAEFGDCVSRADSANAQALLLSLPDSAAEGSAIAALSPLLAGCVPKGQNVRFSRSILRAGIAEGLYRLSRAQAGRPWGVPSATASNTATVR